MQGVPLRLEIGPKDMEQNQCVLVRRDNREKQFVSLDNLEEAIEGSLTALHDAIYQRALDNLKERPLPPPPMRNSWTPPRTTRALSRPCGAATAPARTKSRRRPAA